MKLAEQIANTHRHRFGKEPVIVRSPGRINVIGEHTDYNCGYVLPGAVNRYVYIGISVREDNIISMDSLNFRESVEQVIGVQDSSASNWTAYIVGMAAVLGIDRGFNITVLGDVPLGAGMSSSAALESAVGFGLKTLFRPDLARIELAKAGQLCEHSYIGVNCGIMDQFASLFGKSGHVIKLDCRDLSYTYFPIELNGYVMLLFDTHVKHSLASSAYNQRRERCEQAIAMVKEKYPSVSSLRDVSIDMLNEVVKEKDHESYRKSLYVVEEIQRVIDSCDFLASGNITGLGDKMFETHRGLSKDFEVSCPELDFLVDTARELPQVIGARMMGGGFGGCTLNIVNAGFADEMVALIRLKYKERFGLEPGVYEVEFSNGTEIL